MYLVSLFLFAVTVYTFGIPQEAPRIRTPTPAYNPCSPNSEQMYPHGRTRRSVDPNQLHRRQFIGVQFIPGQGNSPPRPSSSPAAPTPKYVISQALIQQGPLAVNKTSQELPEQIQVVIANASTPTDQVMCQLNWNAVDAGNPKTGYQFVCERDAYCVIVQQQTAEPGTGFYIYVSLPNTVNTQVAWQVKDLPTAPGWKPVGSADTANLTWGNWYFNGTALLNQEPGRPLADFTGP